jgi:hypothetical protein
MSPLCQRFVMDHQNVMSALLGASAALAGLLLVFLGFIVTASGTLDDDVPDAIHRSLRRAALVLLVAFGIGLISVALVTAWLVTATGNDEPLYIVAVTLFALQLVGLAVATSWTVRGLLWASRRQQTSSRSGS